jgi:hypothetical protein
VCQQRLVGPWSVRFHSRVRPICGVLRSPHRYPAELRSIPCAKFCRRTAAVLTNRQPADWLYGRSGVRHRVPIPLPRCAESCREVPGCRSRIMFCFNKRPIPQYDWHSRSLGWLPTCRLATRGRLWWGLLWMLSQTCSACRLAPAAALYQVGLHARPVVTVEAQHWPGHHVILLMWLGFQVLVLCMQMHHHFPCCCCCLQSG